MRYCIDYRKLNGITKKGSYPLFRIDEGLARLGDANYFSTLDLASGYWPIGLSKRAKYISAICTTSGLLQWKVMLFRLTIALGIF